MNQRIQGSILKMRFLWLACSIWSIWALVQLYEEMSWVPVVYAALVVATSYLLLLLCGIFDGFRIRFEVRDSVLITAIVFVVSVFLHLLFYQGGSEGFAAVLLHLGIGASCVGAGVWYLELIRDVSFRRFKPFRVVLDIEDADSREYTRALLEEHWTYRSVRYYSRDVLKRYRNIYRNGVAVDLVVISRVHRRDMLEQVELLDLHLKGVPVVERSALVKAITGRVSLKDTDMWLFLAEANPQSKVLRFIRALRYGVEPVIAATLLLLFSPLILLTAVLVKSSSPGPVLFKQKRLGYQGREFVLYKFRTMSIDAERNGPQFSGYEDDRVTQLGRFLRMSRLDELPQLFNVLRGEMSFIGPRPERPEMYDLLRHEIPLFPLRLLVRPGITGWAQIQYGYASGVEESIFKLEYDLFYIQNMSLSFDVKVMAQTLLAIVGGVRAERARLKERRKSTEAVRAVKVS